MKKNVKSLAYVYSDIQSNDINKLLNLFSAEQIFLEGLNVKSDAFFLKEMRSYLSECDFLCKYNQEKENIDVFIKRFPKEKILTILQNINESKPEMLIVYFTNLPYCVFKKRKTIYNDKLIIYNIAKCCFEIIYDENVLVLTYNKESYPDLAMELKNLFK